MPNKKGGKKFKKGKKSSNHFSKKLIVKNEASSGAVYDLTHT